MSVTSSQVLTLVLVLTSIRPDKYYVIADSNDAIQLSDLSANECICPGDQLMYECTSIGGLATVWEGTAFDCGQASNQIFLRHSKFSSQSSPAEGECNNGNIRALGIRVLNSTAFISQLNVTVTKDMNNKTIECATHYLNGTRVTVGMSTVVVATGKKHVCNTTVTLHKMYQWHNYHKIMFHEQELPSHLLILLILTFHTSTETNSTLIGQTK